MDHQDEPKEHGRDRNKRLTRQALRRAALELGREHDLDAVPVEAIAERAGVSPRTFFNYFERKEDAALLELFAFDEPALTALAQGPADRAWQDLTDLFAADLDRAADADDLHALLDLQSRNPGVASRQLASFARVDALLTATLATRLGGDADARLRAGLMVGSCFTAVRLALEAWQRDDRRGGVRPHLERALAVLAPAFAVHEGGDEE